MILGMAVAVVTTVALWAAVEASLVLRDLARGKGKTARDRGTRNLIIVGWVIACVAAIWVAGRLGPGSAWRLGRWYLPTGLVMMWVGIAIRIWAVVVLGSAFRFTVEVDVGQPIVDSGPYRLVRHPSYTGALLAAAGFGVTLGNWLSAAIMLVIPVATMLRRIAVEEATMTEVIGQPYVAYMKRTKRLVPGLW